MSEFDKLARDVIADAGLGAERFRVVPAGRWGDETGQRAGTSSEWMLMDDWHEWPVSRDHEPDASARPLVFTREDAERRCAELNREWQEALHRAASSALGLDQAGDRHYDPPQIIATHQDDNGDLTSILFHVIRQGEAAGVADRLLMEWPPQERERWHVIGPDGTRRRVTGITLHIKEEDA